MQRVSVILLILQCLVFAETPPNTLTPEEMSAGFELLFDGHSMSKFDVHEGQKIWSVVDSAIKSNSSEGAGNLFSKEAFGNFVLKAEFRAGPNIHAHILLRRGYELQIKDKDPRHTANGYLTASLVNVGRAPADATIRPGQWNSVEVTMEGTHMMITYNGRKVVDGNDSKLSSGPIALSLATPGEAPGENIEFRNLKIKRLP